MNPKSILIVEDEPDLREGLALNLSAEGFDVDTAATGTEGLEKARGGAHAIILLDLMLPGMPGLDVLRALRTEGLPTPVIVVSAKDAQTDKISCLDAGADDYVTKPFSLEELAARIKAVLRRSQEPTEEEPSGIHRFPGLTIDFRRFTVTRDGVEHQLSRFESEILRTLVARRGEVVTRRDLLMQVWGYKNVPHTRTVDNHVARLRKKVEDNPDSPVHVVTVHGIGYRFDSMPIEGGDES